MYQQRGDLHRGPEEVRSLLADLILPRSTRVCDVGCPLSLAMPDFQVEVLQFLDRHSAQQPAKGLLFLKSLGDGNYLADHDIIGVADWLFVSRSKRELKSEPQKSSKH